MNNPTSDCSETSEAAARAGRAVDRTAALTAAYASLKESEERLLRQNQWLTLLSEAAAELLRATDPDQMVRDLFERVKLRLGVDVFFNFMLDDAGTHLCLDAFGGVSPESAAEVSTLRLGQIVCGTVAVQRQRIVVTDIQAGGGCLVDGEDKAAGVRALGIRAYACHPLLAGDRLLGTLSFGSYLRDRFEDDELEVMQTISHYVAIAKERLRAARALRESEARSRLLALVVQNSPDFIGVSDIEGVPLFVNDAGLRAVGLTWEQARQTAVADYFIPEQQNFVRDVVLPSVLRDGKWAGELNFLHRGTGMAVPVLYNVFRVDDPDTGMPANFATITRVLTEQKRAEAAMRQTEDRLRRMIEASPVGMVLGDTHGGITEANDAYLRLIGVTREDVRSGRVRWDRITPPEHTPADRKAIREAAQRGVSAVYEKEFERPDGSRVPVLVASATLHGVTSGGADELVTFVLNISERKRAEEDIRRAKDLAERASEAKSQFLATLSHELRTPLTPVLLAASLIEGHPSLPDEVREDVATIRRNVELESRLISDLLDLTRIERGKLELDTQDVDVHIVLRSAIAICQREASARLTVELNATAHTVRGDSTRLQQIFWNLVNNAIKFTGPAGTIVVRTSDVEDDGNDEAGPRVRVEVIDSGAGIDAAVLPKLFSAFEQGEVRVSRQQAGLGLGLAISRRLAEAHGGTVTAASEGRGKGSTFTVELPAVVSVVVPAAHPSLSVDFTMPPAKTGNPLSILLVEDHEPTLGILSKALRGMGHRVTAAATVASATASVAGDGFDLIISDLGLPDGSGLDLMRQVREQYMGRAIALTGYGMDSDVAASKEAGFAEHLTKPVDVAALEAAIARVGVVDPSGSDDDGD